MADYTPKALAERIAKILDDKKASDLRVLKIDELTVIADYFIICTGNVTTHVRSLSDEVEFLLKQEGVAPLSIGGYETSSWILLDYGSVVVHIFLADTRSFYSLERLWSDAPEVKFEGIEQG